MPEEAQETPSVIEALKVLQDYITTQRRLHQRGPHPTRVFWDEAALARVFDTPVLKTDVTRRCNNLIQTILDELEHVSTDQPDTSTTRGGVRSVRRPLSGNGRYVRELAETLWNLSEVADLYRDK